MTPWTAWQGTPKGPPRDPKGPPKAPKESEKGTNTQPTETSRSHLSVKVSVVLGQERPHLTRGSLLIVETSSQGQF